MEKQKFSVAMCVYGGDKPEWFRTAVESILNQTVPPDEVVMVVDGPVPKALDEVICGFEKSDFLKVIRLEQNQGHGVARRTGLENCSHELVALMDADDISVENRFELQLRRFTSEPELDIVGGNISEFIDEPDVSVGMRIVPRTDAAIKEYMKNRCPMNQVTVMLRKKSVIAAGGYLDWYCNEDYYLWIRMHLASMRFGNVGDTLVHVRVGKDMYQRRGGLAYFKSEARLQKYMLDKHVIGFATYCINVGKRLILQVLMPNNIRGWVFRKFARSKAEK